MLPAPALLLALRRRLFAAMGVLLLATACLQAVGPFEAPLERRQGSAFSAATADVAVVRPLARETQRLAPAPLPLAVVTTRTVPRARAWARLASVSPRPDSTGPPPADLRLVRPGPRAPPLA